MKVFVLSWSVKALAVAWPVYGSIPVSVIPGVTLRKDPSAVEMRPDVTWATKSLLPPPPTVSELFPPTRVRGRGNDGGVVHGTSCQSVFGYETLKHPSFGRAVRTMDSCQVSRLPGCASAGEGSCAMSGGETEDSRPAKTMALRMILARLRAVLGDLMGLAPHLIFALRISQQVNYTSDFAQIESVLPVLFPRANSVPEQAVGKAIKSYSTMGE